ncbi:hypothetical protein OG216_25500 [Streptomycetaceae bacterium NBC_01309]
MPPAYARQPPPEPPRNARGETPAETERRWLGNIASVVFPMVLAARLLKPKYRCGRPDPIMDRVIRLRAWVGLTVVFGVFLRVFYEKKTGRPSIFQTPKSGESPSVPSFPTNQGLPAPGSGGTGMPSIDTMANMPMPQATRPTSIPTGFDLPTNLPTGMPTGFKMPSNFPTAAPTGGSGLPPGVEDPLKQAEQSINTLQDGIAIGQELVGATIDRLIIAPVLCALGIVVIGLLLALFAAPHARSTTVQQLRHPIRVVILFAVITAAGIGAYVGLRAAAGLRHKTYMLREDGTGLQLVMSWVSAFALFWTVLFALGALWQVTRHFFAAIDGHPLLPALLGIWLAWSLVLNDLALHVGGNLVPLAGAMDTQDTVPDNVKAALGILGATIITALALWEIARVNKWNGINFRSGPFANRP